MRKILFFGIAFVLVVLGVLFFFRNCEFKGGNIAGTPEISARLQGSSLSSSTIIIKTDSMAWVNDSTLEVGVCWNLTGNPEITDSLRRTTYKGKQIMLNIGTSLVPGNKYYVRAYLKGKKGITYSEQFPLLASKPKEIEAVHAENKAKKIGLNDPLSEENLFVSRTNFISTYQNEASFNVDLKEKVSGKIVQKGVVYGVVKNPTLAYNRVVVPNSSDSFSGTINNLMPNKSYYVRPYVITNTDTLYGAVEKVTTPKIDVPTVLATTPIAVSGTTFVLSTEVIRDGGAEATERGVCWGKEPNPTVDEAHTVDSLSSGLGKSSVVIEGLEYNSSYFVRPYASNGVGISYGPAIKIFTPVGRIGDLFGGGIIFYLDETGRRGAVCAEQDQAKGVHWLDALAICQQLELNGYSDWTLPSKEELDFMYTNLFLSSIGELSNYYWSSTESDFNDAWYWRMNYGTPYYNFKGNVLNVRAIRRF